MNPLITDYITQNQIPVLFLKKQILTEVWIYSKEIHVSFSKQAKGTQRSEGSILFYWKQ